MIVGFDEVGRGSLAGPVMVGAAAIRTCDLAGSSPLAVPDGVADSKMLTEHRREAIFEELKSWCASWAVGSASNTEIDDWASPTRSAWPRCAHSAKRKRNSASTAMACLTQAGEGRCDPRRAERLHHQALNTFDAPDVPVPADVATKVKGDRYCATVATAAVIAKVTRDRLMVELGAQPQYEPYEWAHNKGYGSAAHRDAIAEFGPSDLHRLSWHLV